MGVLNDGRFQRGLIDIPLVFSDAYMLADTEVQKIFEFSSDLTTSVCIGSINDYKEEKLFISANLALRQSYRNIREYREVVNQIR